LLCLRISALAPWITSKKYFQKNSISVPDRGCEGEMDLLLPYEGAMIPASACHTVAWLHYRAENLVDQQLFRNIRKLPNNVRNYQTT
jgi:hypothetical protein